jgi:hypothetical protein
MESEKPREAHSPNRPIRKQGKANAKRTTPKTDAAPHRGNASRPIRIQRKANTKRATTKAGAPRTGATLTARYK